LRNVRQPRFRKGTNDMSVSDTVQEMLGIMARNGLRITGQRRTLARIFAEHDGYLSPKDVYDQMSVHHPGVSLDTVYRNLRELSERGVLEQFHMMDGGLKFRANCHFRHHHHLICMNCEKTLPFDYCPMDLRLELPGNYKIVHHRFEIYGICEDCQTKSAASAEKTTE